MTRGCAIGLAGRRAASIAARLRARGRLPRGRVECPAAPLSARLLTRGARRVPATVVWARHTELRLAPVTILGPAGAPAAAVVGPAGPAGRPALTPAPGAAPAPALAPGAPRAHPGAPPVRETLRERVERTVERVLARGRRDEPARRATVPVANASPRRAGAHVAPIATPVFPALPLPAPAAAPAAAAARARDGAAVAHQPTDPMPSAPAPGAARPPAPAQAHELPRLVDAIVGELDRRERAQRERAGWLA